MTENNKCEHGIANGITYLLIGGTIGAVLALLFAPKSGKELRVDIGDLSRKGYDATIEKAGDMKRQSADAVQTVKDKAGAVIDFASDKLASVSKVAATVGDKIDLEAGNGRKTPKIA